MKVLQRLLDQGVESIAVCFLNSYANPAHERQAREIIERHWPDGFVSVSEDLLPEFREYERLSTTVINAYLMPHMKRYLERFSQEVRDLGFPEPTLRHEFGWRRRKPRTCRSTAHRYPVLGSERRRERSRLPRLAARLSQYRHLRHGRDEHRRLLDQGPSAGGHAVADHRRTARQVDGPRRSHRRGGRKQRGVDRCGGSLAGWATQRRGEARPGVLRHRRHRADGDRRQCGARPVEPRLPSRRGPQDRPPSAPAP